MTPSTPYCLLENSKIYSLSQHILAPGFSWFLKKHFQTIFSSSKGLVLDVGCGPALNTPVPKGNVYGVDINLEYIKQYTAPQHQTGIVSSSDSISFKSNTFHECRSFGLLHHLPREEAVLTVREMIRCTLTGGRVIILDNVWPRYPFLRPLAWLNRRWDRGKWVRHEEELLALAQEAYAGSWQRDRFTYTFVGHEVLALIVQKK